MLSGPGFRRFGVATLLGAVLFVLAACSPTLNWREVRPGSGRVSLLLPCKPDQAEKVVPLGGQATKLVMLGCDAGGATFAVAVAELSDPAQVPEVLVQWQKLTLANMKAGAEQRTPLKVPGAATEPAPLLLSATGARADGSAVQGRMAYFAKGAEIVQVVLYAPRISAEAQDTFFSSLRID